MKKIKIGFIPVLIFIIVGFSICNFIYNYYYKIDITSFAYSFTSRIVESPDKEHSILVSIYKTDEDSDIAYIMGTVGALDDRKGYNKDGRLIFWQKINSDIIINKTIDGVEFSNWVDVTWIDAQNININGITLNISNVYDYRRK